MREVPVKRLQRHKIRIRINSSFLVNNFVPQYIRLKSVIPFCFKKVHVKELQRSNVPYVYSLNRVLGRHLLIVRLQVDLIVFVVVLVSQYVFHVLVRDEGTQPNEVDFKGHVVGRLRKFHLIGWLGQ